MEVNFLQSVGCENMGKLVFSNQRALFLSDNRGHIAVCEA